MSDPCSPGYIGLWSVMWFWDGYLLISDYRANGVCSGGYFGMCGEMAEKSDSLTWSFVVWSNRITRLALDKRCPLTQCVNATMLPVKEHMLLGNYWLSWQKKVTFKLSTASILSPLDFQPVLLFESDSLLQMNNVKYGKFRWNIRFELLV